MNLTAEERIIRAKVALHRKSPFFSYLVLHMKMKEKNDMEMPTCGVNSRGDLFYDKKFIERQGDEALMGLLAHEVSHIIFEHLKRDKARKLDHMLAGVAADLVVNDILVSNSFSLPEGGLIPHDHKCFVGDYEIDVEGKCMEEVYDELFRHMKKLKVSQTMRGFDNHFFDGSDGEGDGGGGGGKSDEKSSGGKSSVSSKVSELSQTGDGSGSGKEVDWKRVMVEAATMAKNVGKLPDGIGRQIDELLEAKVDWNTILYKYITRVIPVDYSYAFPSKRSVSTGVYMPSVVKESVDIIVAVDDSGSVSKEELTEFMSEVRGIANSFNHVKMTLLIHDCKIQNVYDPIESVDRDIEVSGGGGTSHKCIYEWIEENKPSAKLVVCLTDLYTEFPDDVPNFATLWVVTKSYDDGSNSERAEEFGEILVLS